jgi:hypothetical protein
MLVTKTITKKNLETIVEETFSHFGLLHSSTLLDSLKLLGFYYATNAGISINIEDLKTPNVKKDFIKKANDEIEFVSEQWQQGFVSDTERFQSIIDSWNIATESLKNRIVDYYQNLDPANNLYIMAFSGARGNMSQVRQLVGLRGLMSDQEGKIIDLPIQANFREGLKSIDYIVSSYGARKGIVDTALKTADSGYLTRRLIYVAQDLVIRQINCHTTEGVIVLLDKKTNTKNILGRTLISLKSKNFPYREIYAGENILDKQTLNDFKAMSPLILNVRSSLTCKSNGSICQKCYGWDLAHNRLISLGETVGIIAAQSIGEPGTQLTMRTFHTGGIFTGETLQQIKAPFSGKLIIPEGLKTISYRTNHGVVVLKLQQEAVINIINWKGIKKDIFLEIGSYLYVTSSSFIKKEQLIAEYSTQSTIPGGRRLKPIYTSVSGEIKFENLLVRKMLRPQRTLKVNQDDGILWMASGKVFSLPIEAKFLFPDKLKKEKPIAQLKIVSPFEGFIILEKNILYIKNPITNKIIKLDFSCLKLSITNCRIETNLIVKNYQYIDKYTVLGFLEIYPNFEAEIYAIRKKEAKTISTFLIITEEDIWKINSDQVNNFSFFKEKKAIVRSGNFINTNSKFSRSGYFLKRDGFKMIFQNATPIFLSRGTILNYKQGDFVLEKKVLATLVNYTQQTEDIVQGLPKIEELIEARRPKLKCHLAKRPGVFLPTYFRYKEKQWLENNVINIIIPKSAKTNWSNLKELKEYKIKKHLQLVLLNNSLQYRNNLFVFKRELFKPLSLLGSGNFYKFVYEKGILKTDLDFKTFNSEKSATRKMEKYHFNELQEWNNITDVFYIPSNKRFGKALNSKKRYEGNFLKANENSVFFEKLEANSKYLLPSYANLLFKPGDFVDLGEPITEGIIDVHDLLNILFQYHSNFDGIKVGTIRSLQKFQLLLVNSIQAIYQSQGVNISSKHIEIIVRQMTSKVIIQNPGDTPLLKGELIKLSLINEIYDSLRMNDNERIYKTPYYEPTLMSATNASLSKDGFLSAAGFQETKRILAKAAIEGSSDWLRGLKESIIVGRLIPAGSSFLNYKHYLDTLFFFKENKKE